MVEKRPAGSGVLLARCVNNDDPASPLTVCVKSKKSDDDYFNEKNIKKITKKC